MWLHTKMKGGGVLGQVGVVKIRVGRVNGWGGLYHLLLYYYSPPRFIQGAGIWSGLGVSGVGGFGGQNIALVIMYGHILN